LAFQAPDSGYAVVVLLFVFDRKITMDTGDEARKNPPLPVLCRQDEADEGGARTRLRR